MPAAASHTERVIVIYAEPAAMATGGPNRAEKSSRIWGIN